MICALRFRGSPLSGSPNRIFETSTLRNPKMTKASNSLAGNAVNSKAESTTNPANKHRKPNWNDLSKNLFSLQSPRTDFISQPQNPAAEKWFLKSNYDERKSFEDRESFARKGTKIIENKSPINADFGHYFKIFSSQTFLSSLKVL